MVRDTRERERKSARPGFWFRVSPKWMKVIHSFKKKKTTKKKHQQKPQKKKKKKKEQTNRPLKLVWDRKETETESLWGHNLGFH